MPDFTLVSHHAAKSTVADADILSIAGGDAEALHRLYVKVSSGVYGFALSITKNKYDAEDVLQETFISVYRHAGEYRPQGKPMAWVLTIARNHALMRLRNNGSTEALPDSDTAEHAELHDWDRSIALSAVMNGLDDTDRQIVMLHAVSGIKNREIAALLGMPLNTVLSRYHRAIKTLRRRAEAEGLGW